MISGSRKTSPKKKSPKKKGNKKKSQSEAVIEANGNNPTQQDVISGKFYRIIQLIIILILKSTFDSSTVCVYQCYLFINNIKFDKSL